MNHPGLRKHLIVLALVSTLLIGVNSPVANAGWAQYEISALDTYNSPDLPVAFDITKVDFAVRDTELNTYEFYLYFKDPITPGLFSDGLESFAGIFLDLNGDGQDDYSLETNPGIPYSGKKTHAGVFVTRTNGVIAVSTRCAVKTWSDLGNKSEWIAFSIPRTCLPFGKTVSLKGFSDHTGGDNAEYDWAPELQWKLNLAVVRTGSSCTKAGTTSIASGKKYTCIKSGKKLIWNKGESVKAIPSPSPSQTPTPTPSQTPTPSLTPKLPNVIFPDHNVGTGLCEGQKNAHTQDLRAESEYVKVTKKYLTLWEKYNISKPKSLREVDQATIASFATYVSRKRVNPVEVRIFIQPDLTDDASMQKLYRQLISTRNLFVTGFDFPALYQPFTMVAFKDWIWLRDEYISLGCSTSEAQNVIESKYPTSSGGWAHTNLLLAVGNFSNYQGIIGEHNMAILAGHELFHLFQFQFTNALTSSNQARLGIPGWFVEGGASLVSDVISNYVDKIGLLFTKQDAEFIFQTKEARNLNLEDTNGTEWIYSMGLLGSDFLVSIVGFEKFVNVWREMGKGKVFSDAFQDATGIELKDFYQMFYEIRPNLGMG